MDSCSFCNVPILYHVQTGLCSSWTGSDCQNILVSFQLFSLWRLNFTPQIIRVLQTFQFIWSSTSCSNCSILLEYSSNLKFEILLSSSNCSNLFLLFYANVLVSFTPMSISFSLLCSWSNFIFIVSLLLVVTLTALAEISWAKNDFSSSKFFV